MYYEIMLQVVILVFVLVCGSIPLIRFTKKWFIYKNVVRETMEYIDDLMDEQIACMDIVTNFKKIARQNYDYISTLNWYFYASPVMVSVSIILFIFGGGLGYYTALALWGYCLFSYLSYASGTEIVESIKWFRNEIDELKKVEKKYLDSVK